MTSVRDDNKSRTNGSEAGRSGAHGTSKTPQSKNKDMGAALRSVYQKTVEEAVPEDLISLLGKLD